MHQTITNIILNKGALYINQENIENILKCDTFNKVQVRGKQKNVFMNPHSNIVKRNDLVWLQDLLA